ncbi:type II toxin-antitoxin system PemK/MazF family toxin [Allofustis seminis]|uniref:type II toxin-antitoxin system PemK/MazF family toxin n=1 Tax=Allofustis seminis TaxID=166939 RepID=UPI00037923FD|nr:type II toxin-antitoxin system PemK/MazF family toxin [Allofustis seminis]
MIRRGEIYYANLSPVVGSEQGGMRPVLIIQNDTGNKFSPTVIIAPITTKTEEELLPVHIEIEDTPHLEKHSLVLLEQIRTIDKSRLTDRLTILDAHQMTQIDRALLLSLGLNE